MKKLLTTIFLFFVSANLYAADTKLTALSADTASTSEDLLYVVDDPGGTPTSKKAIISDVLKMRGSKSFWWPASAGLPLEVADSIPPIAKIAGTNIDALTVDFDSATDECRTVTFPIPSTIDAGGSATFRLNFRNAIPSSDVVILNFRHNSGAATSASADVVLTAVSFDAVNTSAIIGRTMQASKIVSVATLGFVAGDEVWGEFCRDANDAADKASFDIQVTGYGVDLP